jgi:hypothetical protein
MLCANCKGRGYCGLPKCPIISRFQASLKVRQTDTYNGTSPSIFVGSYGYPAVKGGPILANESDSPPEWIKNDYSIEDIIGLRARTIRGTSTVHGRLEQTVQEIALSSTSLDVEVEFERPVLFNLKFDGTLAPIGLKGTIRYIDVIGNARTERSVDRITSDTDLRATEAVKILYEEGVDTYRLTQLLSAGLLGVKRHVVPTRWAITAIDDMMGNKLKKKILHYPPLNNIVVFSAILYANQIICILIPGDWKFEMIEIWEKHSLWSEKKDTILRDGEGKKKTTYSPIAGAYYSARLEVAEYLDSIQRSARIIMVRRITSDYWAPLGAWVIREATRKAMHNTPVICQTLPGAIEEVTKMVGSPEWLMKSQLIPEIKTQKTLFDF